MRPLKCILFGHKWKRVKRKIIMNRKAKRLPGWQRPGRSMVHSLYKCLRCPEEKESSSIYETSKTIL